MLATAASLVLTLASVQVGPPTGPDSIVWQAARSASGDGTAALEARWANRIAQDPTDPAASLGLAALAFYNFRYDEALERYRRLANSPAAPDSWTVRARLGVGHVLHRRADLPAADSQYAAAAGTAEAIADSAALADALINLALVRARTSGLDAAYQLFEQASAVLPGANDRQRALHRCARGAFAGDEDLIDAAALDEGARIAAAAGEPALQATCMFGRAAIHMLHGVTDSVMAVLDQVVDLQRAANDRYGLAGVLQRRSWYQRAVGNYAGARSSLTEALEHARISGNASAEAWAAVDLAHISLVLRDRLSTVEYAQRAQRLFEAQNDSWGLGNVGTIRARLSIAAGDLEEARPAYERAIENQLAAGDRLSAMGSYSALAEIALHEGELAVAADRLRAARALAEAAGLTGWEQGLRSREARLALARGDAAAARELVDGLLRIPHQPARRYELRVMRARTSVLAGDLEAAEAEMLEAGNDLDAWRTTLDDREFRIQAFQPREVAVGAARVIAALAADSRLNAVIRLAEQRRARDLLDRMVVARAIQTDTQVVTAALPGSLPDLDSWRATAGAGTAMVYYVTGEDEPTTLVLVTSDTAIARVLPPVDSMAGAIDRYRGLVESANDSRSASALLVDMIFADVLEQPALSGTDRLVIIPDGALHRVPFASLVLQDGRYLIEQFALSSAPSMRVAMRLAGGAEGAEGPSRLLALGDPDFGLANEGPPTRAVQMVASNDGAPLPRLAASGREARRVARFAVDADVRTRADASESWLRSATLGRYDIIHFATHALVDEQSISRSALALAPGSGEDGFLGSAELASLSLAADLVVLSACQSAGGVVLRGEGIHGLTAPLLEAGARAIVATQWRIEDAAVGPFVDDLYTALADGLDVAGALQAAQQSSIARGEPPALWAAFTLVGDPGVTLVLQRPGAFSAWPWSGIIAGLIAVLAVTWVVARRVRAKSASNEWEHGGPYGT